MSSDSLHDPSQESRGGDIPDSREVTDTQVRPESTKSSETDSVATGEGRHDESKTSPETPSDDKDNLGKGKRSDDTSDKKKRNKLIPVVFVVLVIAVIGLALSSVCDHEWVDATCTEPKTCTKCGETEGDPLGHDWAAATCTEPETCTRCGLVNGDPLGHQVTSWETEREATCSEEGVRTGVCERCGQAVTEDIPMTEHTAGDWSVTEDFSIEPDGTVIPGEQELTCSVCGATMETKEYSVELTVSQKNAMRTAENYLDFTAFSYEGLVDQLKYEGYSNEDACFAADHCGADWNEQAALCAENYLDFMGFSRSGLIDQLRYEGFTQEQAEYGADAVGL